MKKKVSGCKAVIVDNPEIKRMLEEGTISIGKAFSLQVAYDKAIQANKARKLYAKKRAENNRKAQELLAKVRKTVK